MTTKIYNVQFDYVLIEKIAVRLVVLVLAYNCGVDNI